MLFVDVPLYLDPGTPPTILSSQTNYCPGDAVVLLELADGSIATWYQGSFPSVPVTVAPNFTPPGLNIGDNYFWATNVSAAGCTSNPDSINLHLSDTSLLAAMPDSLICPGAELILQAFGGASYDWDTHIDISDTSALNPWVKPQMSTTYGVTITDAYGCTKSDEILVTLKHPDSCEVSTYTAFTPNEDGLNDYFHIDGIEGYTNNVVTIFNRWGDIVFRTEKYNNDDNNWSGEQRGGGMARPGTYFYVIEADPGDNAGFSNNISGWVQLIK